MTNSDLPASPLSRRSLFHAAGVIALAGTGITANPATAAAAPAAGVPVITSPLSATATVGKAFSYVITAAPDSYVYSATSLPAGLSVDTTTGRIAGTPMAAGTYAVVIAATDAAGAGSATLTLTVE